MDQEKMFSVESSLQQLKPEQIVLHVAEAEEAQWTTVDLGVQSQDSFSWATTSSSPNSSASPNSSSASSPDTPPLGLLLLRHGTSVKKIHSYFSQLEFRKCCLHLAGRRSTAQSMRVVHESSSATLDDGSAKKTKAAPTFVTHLEDKELRAFKHAYLCAAYPVLAAPDPPSPFSPSPTSPQHATEAPKSPYSLHDSGMEEAEDLAFIPSESICSHLQRAFQLTDDKFRDYRHLINKSYVKKSAQKLLAEELSGQLSVLENNCHPFYRPHDFLPPLGYELWRKAEYSHITELLGKFWHFSLPFPRHTQDLMAELHTVHDDYRLLLAKLLMYERDFHRQAEEEGGMLASLLSTASIRLLKEFGLRYGVGEQYRRILYLDQITQDFSPNLGYLRHLLSILNAIADLLPPNRRALAMVKKEYDLLMSSLLRLGAQVAKALEQMKSLFPSNKPVGAVELLIGLLQRVRDLRLYLQTNSLQPLPSLAAALTEIIQGMFFQTYERCKTVIRTELRHSRDIHVCPRMLNALIMDIRQEVQDYRINFETVFRPYFDITVLATRAFYSLLMKDVDTLCQQEILKDSAIDLRMLALVHRLNQLDQDWSAYIKAKEQSWRLSFQTHIAQWGVALQLHIQDLVLETIAGDAFVTQQLQLSSECSPPLSSSSSCSPHTARSVSLTPSINSAFSSLGPTSRKNSSSDSHASSNNRDHPSTTNPTPTPSNAPPHPHSSTLGKDFLSFADKRRHCTSVPVLSDRPAIVRVVSEVKMAASTSNRGLQAASAVEDLRTTGAEKTAFRKLKEAAGKDSQAKRTSQQSSDRNEGDDNAEENDKADASKEEEEPYLLDSRSLGHDTDADRDSDIDEDSDSDSGEETFTFPPLADVTDMDVSDASFSCKEASLSTHRPSEVKKKDTSSNNSGATKKSSITKTGASVLTNNGRNIVWKERGLEGKRRASETLVIGQGQRGRMSCPPPVQRQSSSGSASGNASNSLHPGQAPSQRKPSIVSMGAASVVTESEQPFLQSIQSTVSFPTPHHLGRSVVIPVSGSAIDLLVLLQRTLGFGRSLCQAVYPPHFRARWGREGASGAGGSEDLPGSMGEVSVLRAGLQTAQNNAHLSIVKALCQGIGVYADNMLCLDLCAVPKDIAKRVIGLSLVEHALQQQQQNKIWGCRHQLQGLNTCFAFHNRKATYLSDRYEPITQKMCVRINNVVACQRYLDWCEKQTQAAHLHCAACVNNGTDDLGSMRTSTATTTSTLKGHTSLHPPAASATTYPTGTTSSSSITSSITHADCGDGRGLKQYCLEQTSTHLMSVWTALCRLLAFRINLFLHDGLTLLLTLKPPEVPIATCLTPLTTFLRSHLDALSSWLYRHSFRRVIEFLWIYIVQDIEEEAGKLLMEKGRRLSPHLLLQTLMHLMKFMNNSEKGITRELLLSQADNVVTKLQLFTMSTLHLIALYLRLRERYAEGDLMTQEDVPKSSIPTTALHRLRRDLQTRRKCFSGAQLTHWIVRHADLFLSPDELSLCGGVVDLGSEGATVIAQRMLDTQVIMDVEAMNNVYSRVSSVVVEHQYPEVSLLDQLHGSPICADDRDDDSGDTSIPTPVPPAVPRSREDAERSHRSATSSSTTPQCTQTVYLSVKDTPPQPSRADVVPGTSLTQPSATATKDPVPQASDTEDPVLQVADTEDPVPRVSDTEDPVPQVSDTEDPVPQVSDTEDPVPQVSDTKDPVPQVSDTEDPVAQVSDIEDPVAQVADTKDPVPQVTDTEDSVPQVSDTEDPVPQVSDTEDPVAQVSDTEDPVAQVTDTKDPVAQAFDTDTRDPVAQAFDTDTRDPVAQAFDTDTKDPVAQAFDTDTRDPVAQDADSRDPVAQASDTDFRDPVPQASDTDSRDPVPQASDTDFRDPVPQFLASDTIGSLQQLSDADRGKNSSTQNTLPGASDSTDSQTGTTPTEGDFKPSSSHGHNQVTGKSASELRGSEPEQLSEMKGGQALVTAHHDQTIERTAETGSQPGGHSVSSEHIDQQHLTSGPTGAEQEAVSPDVKKEMEKVGFADVKEVCSGTSSKRVEVTTGMVLETDSEVAMITCMPDLHSKPTGEICTITGDAAVTAKPPRSGGGISELEDSGVAEEGQGVPSGTPGSSEQGSLEAEVPASSSTHSILTRLSAQLPAMPSYSQTALQAPRDGSVYNLDMNSICGTPLSLGSPFTSTTSLFNSRGDKFYFLPPSPTFPPPSLSSSTQDRHHGRTLLTPLERSLEQLKNSEETSGLVEKCFLLKITPTSLLMVLYSRRRTDTLARSFLEQLPPAVQEQLSSGIEMHSSGCSVL